VLSQHFRSAAIKVVRMILARPFVAQIVTASPGVTRTLLYGNADRRRLRITGQADIGWF